MEAISVKVDRKKSNDFCLNLSRYVFKILIETAGFPCRFVDNSLEADIYYGETKSFEFNGKLFIQETWQTNSHAQPVNFQKKENLLLLLFEKDIPKKVLVQERETLCLFNDIIYTSAYYLTFQHEKRIPLDKHSHHHIEKLFRHQKQILHIPFINSYILFLRKVFKEKNPIDIWPNKKKYAVGLSHDVDYPEMIKWIEAIRYPLLLKKNTRLSKLLSIAKGKESFWKFDDFIEKEYYQKKIRSAFYFCSFKGSLFRYLFKAPDTFYDIQKNKYKNLFNKLSGLDYEIGLHSSYNAYLSKTEFLKEKVELEKELGYNVAGNRHHYWHLNQLNPVETLKIHQEIGFLYDSSLGYEKCYGLRNGISMPFQLFDETNHSKLDIIQLPPTLMDDHLFGYQKYAYLEKSRVVDELIETIKTYQGLFIADYHVRVLNATFFPGWAASYQQIIDKVTNDETAYIDTPKNIALYWQKRINKISKFEN